MVMLRDKRFNLLSARGYGFLMYWYTNSTTFAQKVYASNGPHLQVSLFWGLNFHPNIFSILDRSVVPSELHQKKKTGLVISWEWLVSFSLRSEWIIFNSLTRAYWTISSNLLFGYPRDVRELKLQYAPTSMAGTIDFVQQGCTITPAPAWSLQNLIILLCLPGINKFYHTCWAFLCGPVHMISILQNLTLYLTN